MTSQQFRRRFLNSPILLSIIEQVGFEAIEPITQAGGTVFAVTNNEQLVFAPSQHGGRYRVELHRKKPHGWFSGDFVDVSDDNMAIVELQEQIEMLVRKNNSTIDEDRFCLIKRTEAARRLKAVITKAVAGMPVKIIGYLDEIIVRFRD